MSKVKELFTYSTLNKSINWQSVVKEQVCKYTGKKCYKVRKSEPNISIGTCTVAYGSLQKDVIICPSRLLERKQIFMDCMHLLTHHVPGNEIHIVPEVTIPGGHVDFVLVSTDKNRKVKDFVGIELQTMDTTGSVWLERQKALKELGISVHNESDKTYGINWKMTAKTILVQLHHKIQTFENLNRHLVLVIQDCLLDYIKEEFAFAHVSTNAQIGDSMHFHAYELESKNNCYKINLKERFSTDREGIALLLGLNADANVEFEEIANLLESKLSDNTLFQI